TLAAFKQGQLAAVKLFYKQDQYPLSFLRYWRGLLSVARVLVPFIGVKGVLKYAKIVRRLKQGHPQESHFYTELTCVDPRFQKQGIYTALQKQMFRLADQAGVGIYGETSNRINVRILGGYGFQVIGENTIGGATYWSLWRAPQTKGPDEP